MHIHMYMPALINTWTIVWEKKSITLCLIHKLAEIGSLTLIVET